MSDTAQSPFQAPPAAPPAASAPPESGYEIPVESVSLPSKGMVYPPNHPLCNEDRVDIKCMTAKEEDLLTSRALIKNGTVISKLLQSCLLNKTVNPDDLLTGDRNALLIAIRVTGYGSDYRVKIDCPECDETFENEFSLAGLEFKTLGAVPLQQNVNLFNFTLPISKKEVQFKLLTGKDEMEMMEADKRRKKLGQQVETSVTGRLFKCIVSLDGVTDGTKLARAVSNMPAGDSRALRKYIDTIEPSVQMKQWAKCRSCGEQSEVDIPLGISFFWPDAG
jgi:hypothetical protein